MAIASTIVCFALLCLLFNHTLGCSIPEGGSIDLGIEELVYHSDIVAVGNVTEIIEDPSSLGYPQWRKTYGANVLILCSYKGRMLPQTITIGEAGFIPGFCYSMDLESGNDYILFLQHDYGDGYYRQRHAALPISRLNDLTNVCDLELWYSPGNGYHWKGLYVESMQEALSRGNQCRSADMFDIVKYVSLCGEYINKNYGNKFYAKCQNLVILLKRAYDVALEQYDVIVMPTLPSKAPKLPEKSWSLSDRMKCAFSTPVNTSPFDASGHPALSINAGFSEGLPVGMMIVGKQFDETSVLQTAYAFEKLRDEK